MNEVLEGLTEEQLTLNSIISHLIMQQKRLVKIVIHLANQDELLLEAMCKMQGIDLEKLREEYQSLESTVRNEK